MKGQARLLGVAIVALVLICGSVWAEPEPAEGDSETKSEIEALKAELTLLRIKYQSAIEGLEDRILRLEESEQAEESGAEGEPGATSELALLRAAAEAVAVEQSGAAGTEAAPKVGRQTALNRLNPEISATGIVLGVGSDREREEFRRGEFEVDIQATLDPFSRTRMTIAFGEDGEVEIEEGYLLWTSLPGGLNLTAGKFRERFGALNRQHLHALPQTNYPLALAAVFGEEGLAQAGVSASWLLSKPWASANEISIEFTDGENDFFGGESFDDFALLARLNNYWDLSSSSYLEWGLTAMSGRTEDDGEANVWGTDITYHWQPPTRAKYREITWRTEVLTSRRENRPGEVTDSWGGYTYLEGLIKRNLYLGARFDWTEDPFALRTHTGTRTETWGVAPYVTWWQSEWVRLRTEYQYLNYEAGDTNDSENRFTLQLTWAAGPHRHESY